MSQDNVDGSDSGVGVDRAASGWHRVTVTSIFNRHLHAAAARIRAIASAWQRPSEGSVGVGVVGREGKRREGECEGRV
jgi:hypothetical protein